MTCVPKMFPCKKITFNTEILTLKMDLCNFSLVSFLRIDCKLTFSLQNFSVNNCKNSIVVGVISVTIKTYFGTTINHHEVL